MKGDSRTKPFVLHSAKWVFMAGRSLQGSGLGRGIKDSEPGARILPREVGRQWDQTALAHQASLTKHSIKEEMIKKFKTATLSVHPEPEALLSLGAV